MKKPDIRAAGAVVLREQDGLREALIIHRPRYDDWSLPKGKLERNETAATCAVREVLEETGVRVRLVQPLSSHRYPVKKRLKEVDWWRAEVIDDQGTVVDTDEVDQILWLPVDEAADRVAYADERDRLLEAAAQPPTTPLLVLRHAKALPRKKWDSDIDSERPITDWGQRQSRALVPFLAAFGVRRVISSSARRCLQTVSPYARHYDLALEGWNELTEEMHEVSAKHAKKVMRKLGAATAASGVPTVVCGHRPVFPAMLDGLSVRQHEFETAETLIVSLLADGTAHGTFPVLQRLGR